MSTADSTVHTAIHTWASTGTGLGATSVFWAQQNVSRPAYPYGALRVLAEVPVGGPSAQFVYDGDTDAYTPVIYSSYETTIRVEYASLGNTPTTHARKYAKQAIAQLANPVYTAAFRTAGLGVNSVGGITDISEQFNGEWITRVFFDLVINVVDSFEDTNDIGYIAHIEGVGTVERPDENESTVPFESDAP